MMINPRGVITLKINYKNNKQTVETFPNILLAKGKSTLARFLVGSLEEKCFVTNVLFGDGGFDDASGKRRTVDQNRNSLFGITRLAKPVVAQVDPTNLNQAIFTFVIKNEEANNVGLSEMALKLSSGDLFSMATFPILNKTEDMELVYNWRIIFS